MFTLQSMTAPLLAVFTQFILCICANQSFAQTPKTTINFDQGVDGASMTPIGSDPLFHYREQVVYGTPEVQELSDIYPTAQRVRVYPTSQWNGQDVTVFENQSTSRLDFWFGDPFEDGTRVSYSISTARGPDLMRENPVGGNIFKPYKVVALGDRFVAYCAVQDDVLFRWARIAIISAPIEDVKAGVPAPWEVQFISGEYSQAANNCGGIWAMSDFLFYEGAYWSVATDYDSGTKTGGQCWLIKFNETGLPVGMVRLHTRAGQSNEHWHSGTIIRQANGYKAVWHVGDRVKRLYFRDIDALTNYEANAITDAGSGEGGLYQTKIASETDWGPVSVAAGPAEDENFENTGWQNCFVLGQDPQDESRFLYGGDVAAGLIQRVSINEHDVAVCEPLFNPMSRTVRQQIDENVFQLNVFLLAQNGLRLAGTVSSQLDNGANVDPFSGYVVSEDGGQTWGWAWKGTPGNGVVQNAGVAVLSNGRIIAGALNTDYSVRGILPGERTSGFPLFVGYRPPNLIGNAGSIAIMDDGGGVGHPPVLQYTTPEKPLPPIVHQAQVMRVTSGDELPSSATIQVVDSGIDQGVLASGSQHSNLSIGYWVRRSTPSSHDPADRVQVETRLGWFTPGSNYGTVPLRFSPAPRTVSDEWVRMLSMYDGEHLTGDFLTNPGSLFATVSGAGGNASLGRNDLLLEYVSLDHDRPALPYQEIDDTGIASAKFTDLGLGESWTVIVTMQIPEETWDSWSGNESDTWEQPAPLITVSDIKDQHYATVQAQLHRSAMGGAGAPFQSPDFTWMVTDSESTAPSEIHAYPLRTTSLHVALSKDRSGKLLYAMASPSGFTSGSRIFNSVVDADTIRLSDIAESDALEMYIHQIRADCHALTLDQLETLVYTLEFPQQDNTGCGCTADLNGDGVLNFFDVSEFLQAYTAQNSIADMNADGMYDFFDVSIFITAYSNGCD